MKLHDNPTSPILLPQLRALQRGGVKRKTWSRQYHQEHKSRHSLFPRKANCKSPLGGICKTNFYLQLLPAWMAKLKSFCQASQEKESSISWILWLVLANSWGERKWLAGGDTLRIYEAADWNLNCNWNSFLFLMLTLNCLFFPLRFFA